MLDKFVKYLVNKELDAEWHKQYDLLREGLIRTHDFDEVQAYLSKFFSNRFDILSDKKSSMFAIIKKDPINDKKPMDYTIEYMNNMGYFVSSYVKDGKLINATEPITDYDGLRFEAKFDVEESFLPQYYYHVTDKKHLPKILKIGLTPKTKSKLSHHPERIYLAKDEEYANDIMKQFLDGGFIKNPVILRIKPHGLTNVFLKDQQYDGGVYTQQNIPPKNIEIVEE